LRRRRGAGALAALAALVLAVACAPIATGPTAVAAPVNTCPCSAYQQGGAVPQCNGGACVVAATFSDLVLAVSLSEDSYFAPGQTFIVPYSQLFGFQCGTPCTCVAPQCAQLPPYGLVVAGDYLVTPQVQQDLDWNLGNTTEDTALPVTVTYRPLWPQSGSTGTAPEAVTVGLPVLPLDAQVVVDQSGAPGPNGGPSIGFEAYLQPADYERTIAPDPPFDAAFPPDIQRLTIAPGNQVDQQLLKPDLTMRQTSGSAVPTFQLSRIEGFDGWTAYLRDMTSLRRISSVATLSGPKPQVILPTNHHPPDGDALTNAELVLQPPAGQAIPTGVYPPTAGEIPVQEPYFPLPAVPKVTGNVEGTDLGPVEADLVFEAIDIYDSEHQLPNSINYEYTGVASARLDGSGASTYSLDLPPGDYRLTIRPLDLGHAVTTVKPFTVLPSAGTSFAQDISVDVPSPVTGSASISDGRALAGATVVVVPVACGPTGSTQCLPRGAQTTTAADGSFQLSLDPGTYQLRVEPQEGTRFPWVVVSSLLVGPTPVVVPPITVPAPVYAGLRLQDAYGNPIVAAIVRVYQVPTAGTAVEAVEIGAAMTDATGHYDMYLAPTSL
jgi:hypothetical protein